MKKIPSAGSVRERKADALDIFVKGELARTQALDIAKRAKLRALRLAREEEEAKAAALASEGKQAVPASKRRTMHLPKTS